jgi:hypothetical protein
MPIRLITREETVRVSTAFDEFFISLLPFVCYLMNRGGYELE